jgi:transposase
MTQEEQECIAPLSTSRTESLARVERAKMLLAYSEGDSISSIARNLQTNRPKVERCIDKALQLGAIAALDDLPRSGAPAVITDEARAWVVHIACTKPKELGYSYELWTTDLMARHIRANCLKAGHPSLSKLGRGTVSKILAANKIKPHKINYYLERRDAAFEEKMAQVLCVYQEVALLKSTGEDVSDMIAILSYDEKPGIQAIGNTAPDLAPVPGRHGTWSRDHEYVRHGTVSLMAGIDLLSGMVHGIVVDRHRSREFIQFLKIIDGAYPKSAKIRIILDNHSAHISRETRAFLSTVPNRFEFVFTPKHGSWLNLIEMFFSKMSRSMLRGIRVESKAELKKRIYQYLEEINHAPTVFRWKYEVDKLQCM